MLCWQTKENISAYLILSTILRVVGLGLVATGLLSRLAH